MVSKLDLPVIACGLLFGLGGCVAAPLAQVAVSQMASPAVPCVNPSGCSPGGGLGGVAKGVGDSFHKLTDTIGH
jgi:hypothetical protein